MLSVGFGTLIIAFRSRYSVDRLLSLCRGGVLCVVAGCAVWFGLGWLYPRGYAGEDAAVREEAGIEWDRMVGGALGLKESQRSALGLAIEEKLVLVGLSTRPGVERAFRFGMRGSEKVVCVKENEVLSLGVAEGNKVAFDPAGAVRLSVQGQDERSVVLQMEGEKIVLVGGAGTGKCGDVEDLKGGRLWGHDLLYRSYGGTEYGHMGRGAKVELEYEGKPYFVYVSGGYLAKKEGQWVGVKEADVTGPLARVKELGPDCLEVEAWDSEGFSVLQTKWQAERKGALQIAADQLITAVKLRTSKQISCKIAGKRFLVKPGDWLMKTQTGWHKLVSVEEIEAYLAYRLRGELIVVDDVDALGRVKGHYFDPMRTQMQSFSLQAVTSKKKEKKRLKK